MTDGHKHRVVRVKKGSLVYRLLRYPLIFTDDRARVEESPYPYGESAVTSGVYYLSLLGILHRWTGLTLTERLPKVYRVDTNWSPDDLDDKIAWFKADD